MFKSIAFGLMTALAASTMIPNAHAQNTDKIRICTAKKTGNYFYFGKALASAIGGGTVLETEGSYDNFKKMVAGDCDAAVVQSDAWFVYQRQNGDAKLDFERVGKVFTENALLVCNGRSGIKDLGGLNEKTPVAVGPVGSGSWITWNGMLEADKTNGSDYYSKIPQQNYNGARALNRVLDGSETSCLFDVSSPGTSFMTSVADASRKSSLLNLADVKDKDFTDTVDSKGNSVYRETSLSNKTYPGFDRWTNTTTLSVDAILVVKNSWIDSNSSDFDTLSMAFNAVAQQVRADKKIAE